MTTFGQRLRYYRTAAKLTQPQLAKAVGWEDAQSRISQYEHNKREPTLGEIKRLAEALKVAPQILAYGELETRGKRSIPQREPMRRPKKGGQYPRGQKLTRSAA